MSNFIKEQVPPILILTLTAVFINIPIMMGYDENGKLKEEVITNKTGEFENKKKIIKVCDSMYNKVNKNERIKLKQVKNLCTKTK